METKVLSAGKMTPTFSTKTGYTISFSNGLTLEFASKQIRDTFYQSMAKGSVIPKTTKVSFLNLLLSFIF